jgi:hypothetical protein
MSLNLPQENVEIGQAGFVLQDTDGAPQTAADAVVGQETAV